MRQYTELIRNVLDNGQIKHPPQGVDAISLAGATMRFNLDEGFPLLTTRSLKGSWKAIRAELLWMLSGSTNANDLHEKGVRLWDDWATEEICSKFERKQGELGPLYGHQWRNFGATPALTSCNGSTLGYHEDGVDQIQVAVNLLLKSPDSRRIRVSSWNPKDVWKDPADELEENVFITPCHGSFQLFHAQGELSMILTQYSGDVPIGIPFNTAEYALLLMMIAQVVGMKAKELIHFIGDAHIYVDQVPFLTEQLQRSPRPLPTVRINPEVKDIFSFKMDDFELVDYDPHPPIKGIPVAV